MAETKREQKNKVIKVMKRKFQFSSVILLYGIRIFIGCLLANGLALRAQDTAFIPPGTPPPGGANHTFGTGGEFSFFIGPDMGTILLKTCDLDQNGKVTLAELKEVAAACFKLWDTNTDGSVSGNELTIALKGLFPAPPGGTRGMRVVNGVEVEVAPGDLPTPDRQLSKHIMALADANKEGLLNLQELNDWLDKSFSQWDQNGDGSLDAQEFDVAFRELVRPDLP